MNLKTANIILKKVLGNKGFLELLDFMVDRLNEKLGEDHCVLTGITYSNFYKIAIAEIGLLLSKGYDLEKIECRYTKNIMKKLLYNSLEDFYNTYKNYIETVKKYIQDNY